MKEKMREEVEQSIEESMQDVHERLQGTIDAQIGSVLGDLFNQVDKAMLQPGFGGLLPVSPESAQRICDAWNAELSHMASTAEASKTFVCRMLEDGSLFLKVVNLPSGVVVAGSRQPSEHKKSSVPLMAGKLNGVSVESGSYEAERPKRKTLTLGSNGLVEVK